MDSKKIEELLEKYWDCETTLEEESLLREYFQQPEIAEKYREAAPLFRYFGEQKNKTINDSAFDKRILPAATKKDAKVVHLIRNSMRIAAGVIVLMVAVWFMRNELRSDQVSPEDTFDDPKMAFEETKKALMMISKGFTRAEQETRKINLFNEAQKEIQKSDSEKSQL